MKRFSSVLQQIITIDDTSRTVTTDDGIIYNEGELASLRGSGTESIMAVHKIKKYFKGVLINNVP
jgi:hypothetical protein